MFLKTLDLKDTATERTKRPFTKIIFSFSEYTIYWCLGVKMISFVTYFCQKKKCLHIFAETGQTGQNNYEDAILYVWLYFHNYTEISGQDYIITFIENNLGFGMARYA